ncbi:MAG TPA: universal stress protein [Burkholderiales bacterium]|nr:universal stress protein [Burkholderiales bacterium]
MFKRILVPTDGSKSANQALKMAIGFAVDQGAKLRVVHILEDLPWQFNVSPMAIDMTPLLKSWRKSGEDILKKAMLQAKKAGLIPEESLIEAIGETPSSLISNEAQAWNADLIIVGTHGRHGIERLFLGSVAEGIARTSPIPVMLVHKK